MSAVSIRLERLSKRFHHRVQGEVYAARDVSLTVAPGEFVTLLGPSGCGKTTTLRMIAGFETPDAGRVFIGDEDVTALMANRRNIGFVFQNYALFPHLTVFENVAYGLRVRHLPAASIRESDWNPMSFIAPSPPMIQRRFCCQPWLSHLARTPIATAGAFSNNEFVQAIW